MPGIEMGHYGEEGHPVQLPVIEVPIEKAWNSVASTYDSERGRQKRAKVYEGGALVAAGGAGAYTGHQGRKAFRALRKVKPNDEVRTLIRAGKKGGKTAAGAAGVAAAAGTAAVIHRKQQGSWASS
jgi:hypothetical protein